MLQGRVSRTGLHMKISSPLVRPRRIQADTKCFSWKDPNTTEQGTCTLHGSYTGKKASKI